MSYLAGNPLDETQFEAVREYLIAFIHAASPLLGRDLTNEARMELERLRLVALQMRTRAEMDEFVSQAADVGLDPF